MAMEDAAEFVFADGAKHKLGVYFFGERNSTRRN
jgi:hypothetical protein